VAKRGSEASSDRPSASVRRIQNFFFGQAAMNQPSAVANAWNGTRDGMGRLMRSRRPEPPLALHKRAMPSKECGRRDDEARPAPPGQQACRRGEEQPVTPSQLGAAGFALEDLHLVAQDEDLDLAVALIALRRQTQDGAQHHVEE
jgi:hypothetical protein